MVGRKGWCHNAMTPIVIVIVMVGVDIHIHMTTRLGGGRGGCVGHDGTHIIVIITDDSPLLSVRVRENLVFHAASSV
jgi:hypothetical protein